MMGSVCAEQQHKFHHSHQLYLGKKNLREIDIPPRKLLSRRNAALSSSQFDAGFESGFMDSPKAEEAIFRKFLPYNNVDDDDADPYSSDHFRMYEFKVRKCTRSRSHDWTDCPFAHPGEKARRRDPRRYHYSGTVCSEFRKGQCSKGDNCEFAHGVFECWLHPTRYRTEACKDGKNCKRKVCFFAHTPRQLRILPDNSSSSPVNSPVSVEKKYRNVNHCCVFCHSVTTSPTSTLMGISHLSPPISPPISPVKTRELELELEFSPVSRFGNFESCGFSPEVGSNEMRYKDALNELMTSLEAMNVNESSSSTSSPHISAPNGRNLPWLDVNFSVDDQPQTQFILSPSTPSPSSHRFFNHGDFSARTFMDDNNKYHNNNTNNINNNDSGLAGPDLGWVNDLLT